MTAPASIETAVGTASVLHRLALGVECLDAVSGSRVRVEARVDREVDPLHLPPDLRAGPPLVPLERRGVGRSLLRFDHATPVTTPVILRIWDPARRLVARRFAVPLWTLTEVVAADAVPPVVPAASRTLRPGLFPGSAGLVPRGATVVRGRVELGNGKPARWARIRAERTGDVTIGHAHADERGEFVLVLLDTGTLPPPAPSELDVDLVVTAPDPTALPVSTERDPLADLVVESTLRPDNPPPDPAPDDDVLSGIATPPGYVANTASVPTLTVRTGSQLSVPDPIPFSA